MTEDTKELFRPLERLEAPDDWDTIQSTARDRERRAPRRRMMRAAALVAATLAVTAGIVALLGGAFSNPQPSPSPATLPSLSPAAPVADVALGPPQEMLRLPDGGRPGAMVEAYGSIWVLGQFDPASGEVSMIRYNAAKGSPREHFEEPFTGGGEWGGDGVIAGGGYIWAPAWNGPAILRIDPATNHVERFSYEGRAASDVAYDEASGTLWALIAGRAPEEWALVSIDPQTGQTLSSAPFTADASYGVLPARGTVWTLTRSVKNSGVTGGRLEQLSPGTVPAVKIGGSFALPVTDGQSIWSAASGDETAMNLASGIAQVDPVTGEVVDSWDSGPVGYDIAVGPDRGIWFLGADGLERLNPTTGVVDSWPVASDLTPTFIVPARNGVWIGTYEGTLLFRAFKDASSEPSAASEPTAEPTLDCDLARGGTATSATPSLVGGSFERILRTLVSGIKSTDEITIRDDKGATGLLVVIRDGQRIAWVKVARVPGDTVRVEFDACAGAGVSTTS